MGVLDDSYTKSLLHFTGNDEGVVFIDESGKTWTTVKNAKIDSAQYRFAPTSGYFDGASDLSVYGTMITTPDNADFAMGSDAFTVDFWMKLAASTASMRICGQGGDTVSDTSIAVFFDSSKYIYGRAALGSTAYNAVSNDPYTDTTNWVHIALVRNVDTLTLYLNGVSQTTKGTFSGSTNDATGLWTIGAWSSVATGGFFNGWIDEFRISKGIARWTANFTPPTSPYGAGGNEMVMYQDSISIY